MSHISNKSRCDNWVALASRLKHFRFVEIGQKDLEVTSMNSLHTGTFRNHVRTYHLIVDWLLSLGQYSGIRMWLFLTIWKCLQMSITIVVHNCRTYQNCIRWVQNGPHKPGKYSFISSILVLRAINIHGIQLFYVRRVLWADFGTKKES